MNFRLLTLLSVCVSALRAIKVCQPYHVHANDGEIRLNCSCHLRAQTEEVHVSLYRGMHGYQRVCSYTLNLSTSWQPPQEQASPIHCLAQLSPSGVELIISGLQVEDTDFYRCRVEVLYPPPYQTGTGNGTLLHIQEKPSCAEPEPELQIQDTSSGVTVLILATMIAVIVICIVVIITVIVKTLRLSYPRKDYFGVRRVAARRVDCKFGYENFL